MGFLEELRAFLSDTPINQRSADELKNMLTRIGDAADSVDADGMSELEAAAGEITSEIESRAASLASGLTERRAAVRLAIEAGTARAISVPVEVREQRTYDAASPEYREAWLREMALTRDGHYMFGEPTAEQRTAYLMTTQNTGAVVPTDIQNEIIELIESESPLLADAYHTSFTRGFSIPRHKSIDAGDAAKTSEGAAPADDEQNTFDSLSLDGIEIKKCVEMTRKMEIQSLDAFKAWLTTELADRIRVAEAKLLYTRLDDTSVGIASANILTGTLDDAQLREIFGLLRGKGERVVYANNATIWNIIAGINGEDGRKLFVPSAMVDPIVQGRVYGAAVKKEDELADGVFYIGLPKELQVNDFEPINVLSDIDVKSRNRIWSGYALVDAGLRKPDAFVKFTHTEKTVEG